MPRKTIVMKQKSSHASIAQRLEQRPFKSWVQGSNPWGGTITGPEPLQSQRFRASLISTTYSRDIRLGGESVAIVGIVCAQLVFSDSEAGSISPFSHIQTSHGVLMQ